MISVNKKWRQGQYLGMPVYTLDCNGQDTVFHIDNTMNDDIIHSLNASGEMVVSRILFETLADSIYQYVFTGIGYHNGTPIYQCNIDTMGRVVDYAEDLYFRACEVRYERKSS